MKVCGGYSGVIAGIALCIGILAASTEAFEYSGYCQKMCMWGRGGNLCKCNAVHFAGKRGTLPGTGLVPSPDVEEEPSPSAAGEEVDGLGPERTLVPGEGSPLGGIRSDRYRAILEWLRENRQDSEEETDPQLTNDNTRK